MLLISTKIHLRRHNYGSLFLLLTQDTFPSHNCRHRWHGIISIRHKVLRLLLLLPRIMISFGLLKVFLSFSWYLVFGFPTLLKLFGFRLSKS